MCIKWNVDRCATKKENYDFEFHSSKAVLGKVVMLHAEDQYLNTTVEKSVYDNIQPCMEVQGFILGLHGKEGRAGGEKDILNNNSREEELAKDTNKSKCKISEHTDQKNVAQYLVFLDQQDELGTAIR